MGLELSSSPITGRRAMGFAPEPVNVGGTAPFVLKDMESIVKSNSTASQAVAVGFVLALAMAFGSAAIILAGELGVILIAVANLCCICFWPLFDDQKNTRVVRNAPGLAMVGLTASMVCFMMTGPTSAPFVLGVATLILLSCLMWYAVANPKSVACFVETVGATVAIGLMLMGSVGVSIAYALCLLDHSANRQA